MKTIALFGGSFDPPHIGHESVVKKALELPEVEKVIVMPTFLNPFKSKSHAPSKMRYGWLKKIFMSYENVEVSGFEMNQEKKVPSIETVHHLLKTYKNIHLIIGADNVHSLHAWERYTELNSLVTFVVAKRDAVAIPENFITLDVHEDISSTSLRKNMDISKLSPQCADEIVKFYKEPNE